MKKLEKKWQRYIQSMASAERLLERGTDREYAFTEPKKYLDIWWNACEVEVMKEMTVHEANT